MTSKRTWVSGVVMGATLAVACGGSGSSTSTSADPNAPGGSAATSSAFVTAYCDLYTPCCSTIGRSTGSERCVALVGAFVPKDYDAAKGDACLADVRAARGKGTFCQMRNSDTPTCAAAFGKSDESGKSGSKQPGEACTTESDCASSPDGAATCATTVDTKGAETRYCQVQVAGKDGDGPCVGTKQGAVTAFSASGPPVPRGYVCDTGNGVFCSSTSKTCTKMQGVGADCRADSYVCGDSARCDFTTSRCVARLAVGASCASAPDGCAASAYCDATHTCAARAAAGSPCTSGDACLTSACVNGKCASTDGDGGDFALQLICSG